MGSRNYGEAGRCFYVFTRDLGMIYASAQGVRKISSKLRFVLQDFTYIKVDLVRGKDFWRITSASKTNMLEGIARDSTKLEIMVNVSKLLRRLLAGEDPNSILFQDLILGLEILDKNTEKFELPNVEVILVLRILNNLGYIGGQENIKNLIQSPFENDLVYEVAKKKKDILVEINKALKETQL